MELDDRYLAIRATVARVHHRAADLGALEAALSNADLAQLMLSLPWTATRFWLDSIGLA